MNNGVTLNGRALARNGSVTLINDTINPTGCAGVPPSGGVGATAVFSPAIQVAGGVSTKTISLANANASAAAITSFTDNLPGGLVVATPANASNTCGGALSAPAGGSTVSMTGGTIPAAAGGIPGLCTIAVNVTATLAGNYANTLPAGALDTSGGRSTTVSSATLFVSEATKAVPTLTQWAMIALALLLALVGFAAMRRKNT
jgi:hypothetical protein